MFVVEDDPEALREFRVPRLYAEFFHEFPHEVWILHRFLEPEGVKGAHDLRSGAPEGG